MEEDCRKILRPCAPGALEPYPTACPASLSSAPVGNRPEQQATQGSIAFATAPQPGIPAPRQDVPGPMMKTVRDPALSLIALSGIEPSGPVMVEVPLVQNDSTFAPCQALARRRIGVADRYTRGDAHEPIEHRATFTHALDRLSRAGAQLVPVPARQADASLRFDLHTHNEIDALVSEYRLDALVSDSRSSAFHDACWGGYARLGEPLEDGATLWFYVARWSRDSLPALVQAYRSAGQGQPHAYSPR